MMTMAARWSCPAPLSSKGRGTLWLALPLSRALVRVCIATPTLPPHSPKPSSHSKKPKLKKLRGNKVGRPKGSRSGVKKAAAGGNGGVRKRVKWSDDECDFLARGVRRFGEGSWHFILQSYDFQSYYITT